jgi:hypothetical protein
MKLHLILIPLASLSLTGCVAAIPMVAQLATSPDSMGRLCEMTKMPGQTTSFCDRMPFASNAPTPAKAPVSVTTAAR